VTQPGEYSSHAITTRIRGNALIVQTSIGSRTKVMAELVSSGSIDDWFRKHRSDVTKVINDGEFTYVSFLTAGRPICTVVEMDGADTSSDLRMPKVVEVLANDELRMEMSMSPRLQLATSTQPLAEDSQAPLAKLTFFEYDPGSPGTSGQ
jgi:hypothetical protein